MDDLCKGFYSWHFLHRLKCFLESASSLALNNLKRSISWLDSVVIFLSDMGEKYLKIKKF